MPGTPEAPGTGHRRGWRAKLPDMLRSAPRFLLVVPFLVVSAAVTAAVWHYAHRQALDDLAQRGEADLSLVAGGLVADLQRYRDQVVALAGHPTLVALTGPAGPGARPRAERLLTAAADRTGAAALYYTDTAGRVLAGTDGHGGGFPADAVFVVDDAGKVFLSNRSELLGWRKTPERPGSCRRAGSPCRWQRPRAARMKSGISTSAATCRGRRCAWRGTCPASA